MGVAGRGAETCGRGVMTMVKVKRHWLRTQGMAVFIGWVDRELH